MGVLVDFLRVQEHRRLAMKNFAAALDIEPRYRDILIGFGARHLDRAATLSKGDQSEPDERELSGQHRKSGIPDR